MINSIPNWVQPTWKQTSAQLLLPFIPKKTEELLNVSNSAILETFTPEAQDIFTAKKEDESQVLRWHLRHLPLVPWVVQKWLLFHALKMNDDVYSWKAIIKTTFWMAIMPGDIVKADKGNMEIIHTGWNFAVKIEKADSCPWYIELNYCEGNESKMSGRELDRILLQSWLFRFVTWFAFLRKSIQTEVSEWDIFQWYFNVPEDFAFFTIGDKWAKIMDPFLIEEVAAQMWVVAFNENIWAVTDENNGLLPLWKTMTFDSSTCKYSWKEILLGSELRLVWKIIEISKKAASFQYIVFTENNQEVLRWDIRGKIVRLKMLKKMTK